MRRKLMAWALSMRAPVVVGGGAGLARGIPSAAAGMTFNRGSSDDAGMYAVGSSNDETGEDSRVIGG